MRTRPGLARMAFGLGQNETEPAKKVAKNIMPSRLAKKEKALHASIPQALYISTININHHMAKKQCNIVIRRLLHHLFGVNI